MTTASLTLPSRIPEDVVCKWGGIPLIGEQAFSISALEIMERSWKVHVELIITTVMGTSFRVRMSPQETILDIKRRIYYREGDRVSLSNSVSIYLCVFVRGFSPLQSATATPWRLA